MAWLGIPVWNRAAQVGLTLAVLAAPLGAGTRKEPSAGRGSDGNRRPGGDEDAPAQPQQRSPLEDGVPAPAQPQQADPPGNPGQGTALSQANQFLESVLNTVEALLDGQVPHMGTPQVLLSQGPAVLAGLAPFLNHPEVMATFAAVQAAVGAMQTLANGPAGQVGPGQDGPAQPPASQNGQSEG